MDMTPNVEVVKVVTENYLATGESMTVADIAKATGWSESKVRKAIADPNGFVAPGLTSAQETRESYSSNYKGYQTGAHKVWVYTPTKTALREMIVAMRAATASTAAQ